MRLNTQPITNKVSMDNLLEFLFPPGFQHPLVAGRLIAFGMYGPLDSNLCLHSGEKGRHTVQGYELDTMCDQFEREDIMQVYISKKRSLAALSSVDKQSLLFSANPSTKTTKGKLQSQMSNSQMPAFTQEQIIEIFKSLPTDEDGCYNFQDMQNVIIQFRADRIRMLREMDISGRISQPPSWILIETDPQLKAKKMAEKYAVPETEEMKRTRAISNRKLGGPGRGKALVSDFVAPATMFIKNEGYTPNEAAGHTNKMLSTRVYKMSELGPEMNNPGLVQNVFLMRQTAGPARADVAQWKNVCK